MTKKGIVFILAVLVIVGFIASYARTSYIPMLYNVVDSDAYIDGSIDHEHLAADVISGMTDVTSEDADYIMIWDNTDSALKKCDIGEVRGAGTTIVNDTLWDAAGNIAYATGDDSAAILAAGAQGTLLMGNAAAAPSWLAAGTSGYFLLGADAADPVWTTQPTLTNLEGLALTNGDIIYASGANTFVVLDHGTANYILQANGVAAPSWVNSPTISGANITGIPLDGDFGSNGIMERTAAGTYDIASAADIAGKLTWSTNITNTDGTITVDDSFIKLVGDTTGDLSEDLNIDSGTLVVDFDGDAVGIGIATPGTTFVVNGGQSYKRTAAGADDYAPSILTTDYIIAMDNTAVARAVTISTEDEDTGTAANPRIFVIKDESGACNINNITVSLESGGNIDGAATKVMNQPYQSLTLYVDGTNAFIY